jgi:molybdopterin/thiamine biosynthesis adenylyltransferase
MLDCGYQHLAIRQRQKYKALADIDGKFSVYIKEYSTSKGVFTIALEFGCDEYTVLPLAHIISKPEKLEDILLPHVNNGNYLCYVEEAEANWDPNDISKLYKKVDYQIQLTLDSSIKSLENDHIEKIELEGEFVAYWKAERATYVLSDLNALNGKVAYLNRNRSNDGSDYLESILFGIKDKDIQEKWLSQRFLKEFDFQKLNVFIIKVRPTRLSGFHWPPKNAQDLFKWLSLVDHNAKAHLINYFIENPYKHHLIVLEVDKQDIFGVILELNQTAVQFTTYANSRKKGKSGRKIDLKRASSVLTGKYAFNKFQRLSFVKSDKDSILSRNRSRPEIGDLRTKKIALIGCGTIGGYVAELLIRAGAGMGIKSLDLYDHDRYGPHNFSRHTLSSSDFGKYKSEALKNRIENSTHLDTKIEAYNYGFTFLKLFLSKYDIVVDATGRAPVSKRLAYLVRQIDGDKKPIIIHGFNDGNGIASKVFIDSSDGCYNCLCSDKAFYKNGVDIRFQDLSGVNQKRVSCGNTYTPYDASVSVMTAALVQEAVLSTLEHKRDWNYKEHLFMGGRTKKPTWIRKQDFCNICND